MRTLAVILLQLGWMVGLLAERRGRRRSERQVDEQRRELAHLGRVVLIAEMSGAFIHELRQPLTAIRSYAQGSLHWMGNGRSELAKVREGLEAILRAEEHACGVVDRARELVKGNNPQPAELDVNEIVGETLELVSPELHARRVATETSLTAGLPAVFGDRIELRQVLMNVMLNGCDAMSGLPAARRRLHIETSYDEREVLIRVRDAGKGVPQGDLDRIFEPFVTTKSDGLGLGLAICRSIVRTLGGDINASNNEGDGATFQISLSRGDCPASPLKPEREIHP
jgi:C4-dicarboxylate-specific signal transduction histidine kinase